MNGKLMMVGFWGMAAVVAKSFFREAFEPSEIEDFDNLDTLFGGERGEAVGCVASSLYSLGTEIEETLRRIAERYPESRIACYSEFPVTAALSLRCKRAGCHYIAFNITTDPEMVRFKASVTAGNPYYPESIAGIGENVEREILAGSIMLPARQKEVLRRTLKGESVKTTAIELGISDKTVSTHRKRYAQKLGTDNPWQLLVRAYELNLVSPFEVFRSLGAGE
jgi:DNA-binding NarL/FixJ family response regulator